MINTAKQISHKPKLNYINYFRAIAIVMIVLGHSICWGNKEGRIYMTNTFLFKGGTFIFVFIAGFLFQYLSYKFEYLDYLKKKFFNVVLPYFFCITPAIIAFLLTNTNQKIPLEHMNGFLKVVSSYLFGMVFNNPTWFVGMIIIFFIAAPLFLFIKKHKFLWLSALFISCIASILIKRPSVGNAIYHLENFSTLNIYISFFKLYFSSFLFFLSPYLLGMEICTFLNKYINSVKKYIKPILFALCILYIAALFVYLKYDSNFIAYNLGHILIILLYLSFCILFEDKIQKIPALDKILNTLAEYSFGIFFVHQYFINPIMFHSLYDTFKPPVLDIQQNTLQCCLYAIGIFTVTITGCLLLLFILRWLLKKFGVKNTRKFIGV